MTKVINQLIEIDTQRVKVGRKTYDVNDAVEHMNVLSDAIDLSERQTFDQLCELGEFFAAFRSLYPSDKQFGAWRKRSFPSISSQRVYDSRICYENKAKALSLFRKEKLDSLSPNSIAKAIRESQLSPKEKQERQASKEAERKAYKAFKESTHGKSVTEAPSKKETKPKKLTVKQYCEVVISEAKANGISLEILIEQLSVVAQATKK